MPKGRNATWRGGVVIFPPRVFRHGARPAGPLAYPRATGPIAIWLDMYGALSLDSGKPLGPKRPSTQCILQSLGEIQVREFRCWRTKMLRRTCCVAVVGRSSRHMLPEFMRPTMAHAGQPSPPPLGREEWVGMAGRISRQTTVAVTLWLSGLFTVPYTQSYDRRPM